MAGHGQEPGIDVPFFTAPDPVDGGAHVVVDATLGNAAEYPEGMGMGIKQHLVGLQQIGAHDEGSAVAELGMGHLQLGAFAADDGPVFGPVELESLARGKTQGHEGPTTCGLQLPLPICTPFPGKGRHTIVGTSNPRLTRLA